MEHLTTVTALELFSSANRKAARVTATREGQAPSHRNDPAPVAAQIARRSWHVLSRFSGRNSAEARSTFRAVLLKRLLQTCAAVAIVSSSVNAASAAAFSLSSFGAFCDGVHDDTNAIQAWLKNLTSNAQLTAPAGVCLFSSPLHAPFANSWTITGSGPYSTVFQYVGAATNVDLLTISDTGHGGFSGGYLANLRITSATPMTGGAAFHVHGAFDSFFSNLIVDGLSGNGNLFHGFWFDGVGFVSLKGFVALGRGDGIRVNSALGGAADLYVTDGRVMGFGIGLHVGGGVGGIACDHTDFNKNGVGLQIDNAIVQQGNREILQGKNCNFDASFTGDNVLVNDPLANGGTVDLGGWIASSFRANGVNIQNWYNGDVEISGDKVYNNCLDGVYVQDPSTRVFIAASVAINHNGNTAMAANGCVIPSGRGYGINTATTTSNLFSGVAPWNNFAGPFGPSTRFSIPPS